jgi:hypothetical protein
MSGTCKTAGEQVLVPPGRLTFVLAWSVSRQFWCVNINMRVVVCMRMGDAPPRVVRLQAMEVMNWEVSAKLLVHSNSRCGPISLGQKKGRRLKKESRT